jgi:hypothetical protein
MPPCLPLPIALSCPKVFRRRRTMAPRDTLPAGIYPISY